MKHFQKIEKIDVGRIRVRVSPDRRLRMQVAEMVKREAAYSGSTLSESAPKLFAVHCFLESCSHA